MADTPGAEPAGGPRRLHVEVADTGHASAIQRFNRRLRDAGIQFGFPESAALPFEFRQRSDGFPVFRELLVVRDGDEIRAGAQVYHSVVSVRGTEHPFAWLQLPLSEGLINPAYGTAIVILIRTILARESLLMSLGIGSLEETYSRVLLALRWRNAAVPFLFYPVALGRVLREVPELRRGSRARLASALRRTGAAWLGERALAAWRVADEAISLGGVEVTRETSFDAWADGVYHRARGEYGATMAKDAATLNVRYPPSDPRFSRLRVRRRSDGKELGWVVTIDAHMTNHKYFGTLHVGTVVDGFSQLTDAPTLVRVARHALARAGADLIVANFSHSAWVAAFRRTGFLRGPSNFFYFVSPAGNEILEASCPLGDVHVTRGDNDGPGQLLPPLPPPSPSPHPAPGAPGTPGEQAATTGGQTDGRAVR